MPGYVNVSIKTELPVAALELGQDPSDNPGRALRILSEFLGAVAGGMRHAELVVNAGAALASQTATAGTTDGNITVNGVVIAYTGATAAARAADIAIKVNASTDNRVRNNVSASYPGTGAVVTLTSKVPGTIGNLQTLAITGTGASVGGANLAGGTDGGAPKRYAKGY